MKQYGPACLVYRQLRKKRLSDAKIRSVAACLMAMAR